MMLQAKEKKYDFLKDDTIVLFLTEEYKDEIDKQIPAELAFIKEKIDFSYFNGKKNETIFLPFTDTPNIIIVGIGKAKKIQKESLRNSSSSVTAICKKKKIKTIHVISPEIDILNNLDTIHSIAEGLYLSDYSFNKYKTKKNDDNSFKIEKVFFPTQFRKKVSRMFQEIAITGENTHRCRDLGNEISYISNPQAIAAEAKKISRAKNISCKIYGKRDIERMKMGLLKAVSSGSDYPPQLVVLKYRGDPKSKKYIAIVGKGITFDSGGINLKPTGHIEDMRSDMCGAATCIYTIKAAAELKLKKNIYAVIPLCENLLSSKSYRPGDVYKAYNGMSVEIGNTDAEGRLILADALAFTEDKLKPAYIIDIATLTGACLISFGEIVAALLTPDDSLAEMIFNAGEDTGERVWRLPLYKEYDEEIKSDIADVNNIASNRNAGTIIGAVFLKNFVKKTPWAHIDIAGTAWWSKKRGYKPKHATGFGVRLFIEFLKKLEV
jgi:leucyl aminopeptidase